MEILQHLPNGGAVVAIIAVVILFLKKQERYEDKLEIIVERFTAEIAQSRQDYLERLDRSVGRRPKP